MTKRTEAVKEFPLSQLLKQLTEDDMDLGLKLFKDFTDCMKERDADFNAVFCAVAAIIESLSRAKNLPVDQLTSSINNFATSLQATVSPESKNH
jgi:hypothetical protein